MIINKLVWLGLGFSAMLAWPAFARHDDTFAPVAQNAQERTGRIVTWEREENARQQTLEQVRRLLKRPLTANIAAQIALLNNRGLQSTLEQIGLAEADLIEARTIPNPDLNLSARFPDKPPSGTDIEWSIAQDFLSILMIPLRTKIASNELTAVQLRVSDEVTRLVEEAKRATYELQAAQEILSRLKVEQEAQAASLELIQSLHEAGNITDLQLVQQQGEYGQARLEIAQAEAEIRELREKLNRLMGLWGEDTNWKLSPGLPDVRQEDLSVRGLETLAVTQRYDLASAKAELESAVRAARLEKTFRWIGALDFGVDSERDTDSQTITGPTLRLQLPIFNQGQARVVRSEAALRRAYDKFEQEAVEIRSEVRELRDKLISKRDIAQFYRDQLLPTRLQIRDQTQLQYNAMIVSPLELFTARRLEVSAERGYVEAKRDYWVTRAELEQTVGGSLSRKKPVLQQVSSKNPITKGK
ncbi:MAG TPA: TolC family protein [Terriglobales bacterium]|nr:TolC family protein [Terriglobales bacterium]